MNEIIQSRVGLMTPYSLPFLMSNVICSCIVALLSAKEVVGIA